MTGLYKPRTSGGVHSMVAVNRTTKLPYGIIQILSAVDPAFDREQIDLYGGSNPMAWDSLDGNITNDLNITIAEFKPFLYELAGFRKTGTLTPEASGATSTLTNIVGTSAVAATTGIASVGLKAGKTADLKRGTFMVKVVSATTVDVYAVNSNDFLRGTEIAFVNDTLKINSTPLTITTSAGKTEIPNLGVEFTGGSGTIAMVVDDVAYFEIRTPNLGYNEYELPNNPVPIEFDAWFVSQKKSNGEYFIDRYPRVKFNSVPGDMNAKAWTEVSLAAKVMYDNDLGFSYKRYDEILDLY